MNLLSISYLLIPLFVSYFNIAKDKSLCVLQCTKFCSGSTVKNFLVKFRSPCQKISVISFIIVSLIYSVDFLIDNS